jgi:hypothetical protein
LAGENSISGNSRTSTSFLTPKKGGHRNLHAIYGGVEFGLDRFELAQRHAMQGQAGMQLGQSGDPLGKERCQTMSNITANPMAHTQTHTHNTHNKFDQLRTFRRYDPHQLLVYQLCKPGGILFSAVSPMTLKLCRATHVHASAFSDRTAGPGATGALW